MENKIEKIPIENLGFSGHICGALLRAGIYTVGDILNKSDLQIIQIAGIGKKSFEIVTQKIKELKMQEAGIENFEEIDPRIEVLQLGGRISNCLKRARITTISQLEGLCADDMLKMNGIGEKTIEEIKRALSNYKQEKEPKNKLQDLKEQKVALDTENRVIIAETSELKGKLETYRAYKDGKEEIK